MEDERMIVRPATASDVVFAGQIIHEMKSSAIARAPGDLKPLENLPLMLINNPIKYRNEIKYINN